MAGMDAAANRDRAAGRAVAQCVVDQITQGFAQHPGDPFSDCRLDFKAEVDIFGKGAVDESRGRAFRASSCRATG